jgi:hypothetical protein
VPGSETQDPYFSALAAGLAVVPEGDVLVARRQLLAADVLALGDTPYELVPAPGEGRLIWPVVVIVGYTFGTTPYTPPTSVSVGWHNGSLPVELAVNTGTFAGLAATQDKEATMPLTYGIDYTPAQSRNVPLKLWADSNPADGDGELTVTTLYTILG